MITKIKDLIGSLRFWIISFGAASAYMAYVEVSGFSWSTLLNAVAVWLGVVAGIGSLDSIAKNLSGKK